MKSIGILGAGTWGMALARVLADAGHRVTVWSAIEREIDEFSGDNQGLIIAEIELESEDSVFEKPSFLGKEITFDYRYSNSSLAENPYCTWEKKEEK